MKPRKLTLISGVLLAFLIVGTVILTSSIGQEPLVATQMKFTPKRIDMLNTADLEVTVQLLDADNKTVVDEIDPSTVRLEGMIAPISTWIILNKAGKPSRFVAAFGGSAVKGVIWYLVAHMSLEMPNPWNPLPIRLQMTGQLYDDTPWEGSAIILVENWSIIDPPPPPP
jgi:hypothetical protein